MSDDHASRLAALEQLDEDLFDFPEVEGMTDLLAAARAVAAGGAPAGPSQRPATGRAGGAAEARGDLKAPLPAPNSGATREAQRPNAAPRNADDLDEDLFGFGELFELDGGALPHESSQPAAPAPVAPTNGAPTNVAPTHDAPRKKSAGEAATTTAPLSTGGPVPNKAPQPKPSKGDAPLRSAAHHESTPDAASSPRTGPKPSAQGSNNAPTRRELEQTAVGANSPFLTFPASIDLPPARSKLLWVLVGCFLLANGGIFLLTQQQNQNVNQTLVAVTSTLAEAIARGSSAAPRELAPYREPVASDAEPVRAPEPMLDPANFSNTNELGLHNARRLIEQGAYTEARRNLFFILSNQDRSTPLTPTLREDIDYLIALTYYDQGRSIAVEETQ